MDKRLEVNKKSATKFLSYFVTAVFTIALVIFIIGLCNNGYNRIVCIICSCMILAMLEIVDRSFCWVKDQKLYERNGKLIYEYKNAVDILGNDKVLCTILNVTRIHKGRRHLKLYGDLKIKEPLRKTKDVKKITVYDYSKDTYEYLCKYFNIE